MRIMQITQQNLNNKQCVQNNQPNFQGIFVKEALGELDAVGSLSRRVIDVFGEIVKFGTDKFLKVTVRKLEKNEPIKFLLSPCYHTKPEHDFKHHSQNLRYTLVDTKTGKEEFIEQFVCSEKNDDQNVTVNESVASLLQTLMEKFPQRMNLEGVAKRLKGSKSWE